VLRLEVLGQFLQTLLAFGGVELKELALTQPLPALW
jgi:hypothetical protein